MQDSRQVQPVATTTNEEGQTNVDSASACSPVEPQENAGADSASACMSVEETVQTEKTPEKTQEKTPEKTEDNNVVKIMQLTKWTKNLNIQGMGRQRSRLRFTKSKLHKWAELYAESGFQIFKGFDNMQPYAGLHVQNEDESQPVNIVTAGKTLFIY